MDSVIAHARQAAADDERTQVAREVRLLVRMRRVARSPVSGQGA